MNHPSPSIESSLAPWRIAAEADATPGVGIRSAPRRWLRQFRNELAWLGVFSLFVNVLTLAPTLYMLQVYDRVLRSRNEFTLIAVTLILVLFVAMMALAEWLRTRLLVRAGLRFDETLNSRVFDSSFAARLHEAGDNPAQPFVDLTNLRQFMTGNGAIAFFDLPWMPVYLACLTLMHPMLGLIGVVFLGFQVLLAWQGHLHAAASHEQASAAVRRVSAWLQTRLRNAETVQAMGMRQALRAQWLDLHDRESGAQQVALRRSHRLNALNKFVQYSQQSVMLAAGAWLAIHDQLSAGAIVASNALMGNALRPVGTLVVTWRQFIDARDAFGRLDSLLSRYPAASDATSSGPAGAHRGQLTLRGFSAHAPKRRLPILNSLDAQFRAGELVAIVGPSGAGKSTLARCLVGAWPLTDGQILVDGRPRSDWPRGEWGHYVGYLPQELELLDGTVAENVARFGPVESERVIAAARACGIHEMILRLPKGYDTPMGAAGVQLSGGQKQRIALARALYGDPVLVVLDEPTANLDDTGIQALVKAIEALKARGATVFVVLHQHSLLQLADRILRLDDGRIAQVAPAPEARLPGEHEGPPAGPATA